MRIIYDSPSPIKNYRNPPPNLFRIILEKIMIKYQFTLISSITTIFALNLSQHNFVWAKPITYDFTVNVVEGSLKGRTFNGFFSYDDDVLTGEEMEIIGVEDGLKVCMNFMHFQDETKDVDYPEFPQLTLKQGQPDTLDFWVEPSSRRLWWNQNGWQVTLSPRHDNSIIANCQIAN